MHKPPPTSTQLRPRPWLGFVFAALLVMTGCSPLVRPAPFRGAPSRVTGVSLVGPFDGQVVDENTGDPIADARVLAVWSYDHGDGFMGPAGSSVVETQTDAAGRYRVPPAPRRSGDRSLRLVAFELLIYKRGYVAYRSDREFDGRPRREFAARHNVAKLRKWRETDSHAQQLMVLSAPPELEPALVWERELANRDLLRTLDASAGGRASEAPSGDTAAAIDVLDASSLLPPEEVRRRTNFTEAFAVEDLPDLARTHFYHGVHLRAVERDTETWDVTYRVWQAPPGGLASVQQTIEATLPGVASTGEVTPETWVFDSEDVRAVGFLDQERDVGVLLVCGGMQCADIETAIILAKFIHARLDELERVAIERAPTRVRAIPSVPATADPANASSPPDGSPGDATAPGNGTEAPASGGSPPSPETRPDETPSSAVPPQATKERPQ